MLSFFGALYLRYLVPYIAINITDPCSLDYTSCPVTKDEHQECVEVVKIHQDSFVRHQHVCFVPTACPQLEHLQTRLLIIEPEPATVVPCTLHVAIINQCATNPSS
ncbi:hypothetical protein PoB_000922300 [Plakobranchus ocellatus]|uniref:Secreted protein n=1 Tax=Plakobranchus ocellatus TaxID=259542 RepID=A0AAV3YKG7_9GAST|nr:hypothetical protein PoB_000922300 [Plakobranchus ocellatus]